MVLPVLESSIAELCCDMFIFFRSITGCLCDSSEGSNFSKSGKIQSLDENIGFQEIARKRCVAK